MSRYIAMAHRCSEFDASVGEPAPPAPPVLPRLHRAPRPLSRAVDPSLAKLIVAGVTADLALKAAGTLGH